jgi:hypothetical protein
MLHQALAVGISRGFLVAAGIAVLSLIIVIATIRVRRSDLTGATSAPTPVGEAPGTPVAEASRTPVAEGARQPAQAAKLSEATATE